MQKHKARDVMDAHSMRTIPSSCRMQDSVLICTCISRERKDLYTMHYKGTRVRLRQVYILVCTVHSTYCLRVCLCTGFVLLSLSLVLYVFSQKNETFGYTERKAGRYDDI